MPMTRLSMRKIKEVLRLSYELGLTAREVGRREVDPKPDTVNRFL